MVVDSDDLFMTFCTEFGDCSCFVCDILFMDRVEIMGDFSCEQLLVRRNDMEARIAPHLVSVVIAHLKIRC